MNNVLTGRSIRNEVIRLFEANNKKAAVAFWSQKWVKEHEDSFKGAKILLDVTLGMTPPNAIQALLVSGAGVRHVEALHAKVFLSDAGCVLGSANSSMRAQGSTNAAPVYTELALKISPETDEFDQLNRWFDDKWENAHDHEEALRLAKIFYRKNRFASGTRTLLEYDSPLKRILLDPERYASIGVAAFSGDDDLTNEQLADARNRARQSFEIDLGEDPDRVFPGTKDVKNWPEYFISYYAKGKEFRGEFCRTIFRDSRNKAVFYKNVKKKDNIFRDLFPTEKKWDTFAENDKKFAKALAKKFPDKIGFYAANDPEFIKILQEINIQPTKRPPR